MAGLPNSPEAFPAAESVYRQCHSIITHFEYWLTSNHLRYGSKTLKWLVSNEPSEASKKLASGADIAVVSDKHWEPQLKSFKNDAAEFVAFCRSQNAIEQWENCNANDLGRYGSRDRPTVASMLQLSCSLLGDAFRNLDAAFEAGGYGNTEPEISPEWKDFLVERYGEDWFGRMLTNVSIIDAIFPTEKPADRYAIDDWNANELSKALDREWIRVRSSQRSGSSSLKTKAGSTETAAPQIEAEQGSTVVSIAVNDLPKSERLAYLASKHAETKNGRELTDKQAWEYLKEHGFDEYQLTKQSTFADYMNRARRKLGELRKTPRAGREGRSVIKANER